MTPYLIDAPRHVRCIVGVVPFMDMREMEFHKQLETKETLDEFSPVLRVSTSKRPVPLLIVRAGKDEIPDVNKSIDQFVPAALAANYPFAVVNHPDGGHGFETRHFSERSKEVIAQTLEFLRFHLGLSARGLPPLSLSAPGPG